MVLGVIVASSHSVVSGTHPLAVHVMFQLVPLLQDITISLPSGLVAGIVSVVTLRSCDAASIDGMYLGEICSLLIIYS